MTRILSNEDIAQFLSIDDCIADLEQSYRDLHAGSAVTRQRSDTLVPTTEDRIYGLKTMDGIAPRLGMSAVRINSDIVSWPLVAGSRRRVKVPAAPNQRYTGLVLVFSTETGEPLAIMPDGVIQRMRVGATSALGARYMARENASTVAVLGSGWQAGAQVMAICAVRPITHVRCYSPNAQRRAQFVEEMQALVGAECVNCASPESAVADADIVLCATNAIEPVFLAPWMRPGQHLGSIKMSELAPSVLRDADQVAVHLGHSKPLLVKARDLHVPDHSAGFGWEMTDAFDFKSCPTLPQLVMGEVQGRRAETDVTCFVNDLGLGLQFAVVAARCVKIAEEAGIGHQLPTDWFTEDVHP